MRKNVLDLQSTGANRFFLDKTCYNTLELPVYFSFSKLLNLIAAHLKGKNIDKSLLNAAKYQDEVNHIIYSNKDGKYAWRKLEIINPYLYVSLVNLITSKTHWQMIKDRFKELQKTSSIKCASIPVLKGYRKKQKAQQIQEWLDSVEKESIMLSLDFEYAYKTDISDCYGSVYTHSISWALHGKTVAKANRKYGDLLGNKIDEHLMAMSSGQTNGIPQGSILMDFLAEIVLSYSDLLLSENIRNNYHIDESKYRIIRYRDDYRIFVANPYVGEQILKAISETLIGLGMHLNPQKTYMGEDVVNKSVKPDKLASFHDPKSPKKLTGALLRKELLMIYELGLKYPNGGSILTRLDALDKILKRDDIKYDQAELSSILAGIVFNSPKSIYVAASLISKIILSLSSDQSKTLLNKLFRKFSLLPNSGHLELWLQRITLAHKFSHIYKEKLCKKLERNSVQIFNTDWITVQAIVKIIKDTPIIDQYELDHIDTAIKRKEINVFGPDY